MCLSSSLPAPGATITCFDDDPKNTEEQHNRDDGKRDDAVEAPHAEDVAFNMSEIERETKPSNGCEYKNSALARNSKPHQNEIANDPDQGDWDSADYRIGAMVHDAAVPFFVNGAWTGRSGVVYLESEARHYGSDESERCNEVSHGESDASRTRDYHERMKQVQGGARRIAFFGGSFDPPHMGHVGIARAAQSALHLDTVLFAPVGTQPLKPQGSTASFEDRVAMTELAIAGLPNFAISLVDAPDASGEPNYTIDTLYRLQAQFPTAQLFTLLGADSFLSLRKWYRGAEIPFIASLIVVSRPGQRLEDMAAAMPEGLTVSGQIFDQPAESEVQVRQFEIRNSDGVSTSFFVLPGLKIDISASEIRAEVGAALDRTCGGHKFLPEEVCRYIAEHGLYQEN